MEKELVSLTVSIAGRNYPLKVKDGEDVVVRTVVDKVNEKIDSLQTSFPRQDKLDYLSMALLTYALDLDKKQPNSAPNVAEKVAEPVSVPTPITTTINETPTEVIERLLNLDSYLDQLLSKPKVNSESL